MGLGMVGPNDLPLYALDAGSNLSFPRGLSL